METKNTNTNELLSLALMPIIKAEIDATIKGLGIDEDAIRARIDDVVAGVAKSSTKLLSVSTNGGEPIDVGIVHKQFEVITKIVASGANLMLSGQAGNSKSHTLQQVANALGLQFHSMSVSMQTTKTDLLGFVDANGVYRYNGFVAAFRDGGVFNLDEIDAGNPNVLVVLNSAISNGFIELPNGEMAIKHDNFRMCCTANTVGTGANTKYVGRNKLDAATLDRFALVHFELDEDLEEKLCGDKALASGFRAMRKVAEKNFEDIMITMRSCIGTAKLMRAGLDVVEALNAHCFKGIDVDAKQALQKAFNEHYKTPEKIVEKVFTLEAPTIVIEVKGKCPKCGEDMHVKEGKYGKFLGCSNFPNCSHTEKIVGATATVVDDDPFNY